MKQNRQTLIDLMASSNLKIKQVAEIAMVKENTVRVWRCMTGKDIPSSKLKLLQYVTSKK